MVALWFACETTVNLKCVSFLSTFLVWPHVLLSWSSHHDLALELLCLTSDWSPSFYSCHHVICFSKKNKSDFLPNVTDYAMHCLLLPVTLQMPSKCVLRSSELYINHALPTLSILYLLLQLFICDSHHCFRLHSTSLTMF